MSDAAHGDKANRPSLPRDAFRAQRLPAGAAATKPVVLTPDYGDRISNEAFVASQASTNDTRAIPVKTARPTTAPRPGGPHTRFHAQNPFGRYGERSSSRPYALRLPDAIDLVLRQIAAEQRTHPLRIIDRILHEHLEKTGRLPPFHQV